MKEDMATDLEARAASMHLSVSKYIKIILTLHLESVHKFKLEER